MASPEFDALVAEVDKAAGVEASATAAIIGLGAWIAAHKNDPAALQAMADKLAASDNPLIDAIQSNPIPE